MAGLVHVPAEALQELLFFLQLQTKESGAPLKIAGHLEVQQTIAGGLEFSSGTFLVDRWPQPQMVLYTEQPGPDNSASCCIYCANPTLLEGAFRTAPVKSDTFWLSDSQPEQVAVLETLGLVKAHYPHHFYTFRGSLSDLPDVNISISNAKLGALRPQDAEKVTQHWPYSDDSTYARHLIASDLPTLGIFVPAATAASSSTDQGGVPATTNIDRTPQCKWENWELIAWALTQQHLAIGMVHVLEPFRRQGLGKAVVAALSREHVQRGWTPFAYVVLENGASKHMLESLGFQDVAVRGWTLCSARERLRVVL